MKENIGRTLVITDSCCDLSLEQEKKYGLRILNCGVEMDGLPYQDRVEISSDDIYEQVAATGSMPHTSQITAMQFVEEYLRAIKEGYTDIICVTMNSKGSGTNQNAHLAVQILEDEYPAARGMLKIRIIDSTTYSYAVALPAVQAALRVKKGEDPDVVAADIEEWAKNSVTLVGLYNLQYAKRSGRLNACAAFVGDILGVKPIMAISGENKVIDKVRGDRNLIPRLVKIYTDTAEDIKGDYIIAYGTNPDQAKELVAAIKKAGGKAPYLMGPIGPCVAINAGPNMLGLGFKAKK